MTSDDLLMPRVMDHNRREIYARFYFFYHTMYFSNDCSVADIIKTSTVQFTDTIETAKCSLYVDWLCDRLVH